MDRRDRILLAGFATMVLIAVLAVAAIIWIETGHWIGAPCRDGCPDTATP